jgi:hypothetical protein
LSATLVSMTAIRCLVTRSPAARNRELDDWSAMVPSHRTVLSPASQTAPGVPIGYDFSMAEALTEDELNLLRSILDLAREGESAQLAAAIDAGVPVNLTSGAGDSLLILAAYHDHPDTVRVLLDRGADTARVNDRGQTALGAAVFRQSGESVNLLLTAGADPALGTRSALDIARFFELPEMLALLTASTH